MHGSPCTGPELRWPALILGRAASAPALWGRRRPAREGQRRRRRRQGSAATGARTKNPGRDGEAGFIHQTTRIGVLPRHRQEAALQQDLVAPVGRHGRVTPSPPSPQGGGCRGGEAVPRRHSPLWEGVVEAKRCRLFTLPLRGEGWGGASAPPTPDARRKTPASGRWPACTPRHCSGPAGRRCRSRARRRDRDRSARSGISP